MQDLSRHQADRQAQDAVYNEAASVLNAVRATLLYIAPEFILRSMYSQA